MERTVPTAPEPTAKIVEVPVASATAASGGELKAKDGKRLGPSEKGQQKGRAKGLGKGARVGRSQGQVSRPRPHRRRARPQGAGRGGANTSRAVLSANQGGPRTSSGGVVVGPILRHDKAIYAYGNFDQHYANRYERYATMDPRLEALLKAKGGPGFFVGKNVVDIGCGDGFVAFLVASLGAQNVEGVDIDAVLISRALKHLRQLKKQGHETLPKAADESENGSRFPASLVQCRGVIPFAHKPLIPSASAGVASSSTPRFPYNMELRAENVLVSEVAEKRGRFFDIVTCFRLTKWIHLNWGDDGIKVLFHRCYRILKPGGIFVLEAQAWTSYCSRKHLTPLAKQNLGVIQFRPQDFNKYLVNVVGFEGPEYVGTSPPLKWPILLFRRPGPSLWPPAVLAANIEVMSVASSQPTTSGVAIAAAASVAPGGVCLQELVPVDRPQLESSTATDASSATVTDSSTKSVGVPQSSGNLVEETARADADWGSWKPGPGAAATQHRETPPIVHGTLDAMGGGGRPGAASEFQVDSLEPQAKKQRTSD